MDRTEITSKLIKNYGYDPVHQELEIELVKSPGRVYRYKAVTLEEFAAFEAAESKGAHLLKTIIPAHQMVRIDEVPPNATETTS